MLRGPNVGKLFFVSLCNSVAPQEEGKKDKRIGGSWAFWLFLGTSLALLWCPFPIKALQPVDCGAPDLEVFVSILPQTYFVERVGGDCVNVSVMVGPGHSPATYEPMPAQMAQLGKAKLYFAIGVPFENVWIDRIGKAYPDLRVIDTHRGIDLLPMVVHDHPGKGGERGHDEKTAHHDGGQGLKDPHIWLSLRLVKIQAEHICNALKAEDPAHSAYYEKNLKVFHKDLDRLDIEIAAMLADLDKRKFLVLHPSLGYFANDYDLEQIPIEIEGKKPSAKAMARLIREAKRNGLRVVFVQKQFSTRSAKAVAHAIGGRFVTFDPLAKDYLENMRKIAQLFSQVLQ